MEKIYLQLEFGSGKFFTYSKQEKEGYVKHTSTNGKVSYRKYFDLVKGILEGVNIYKAKMGKQTVEMISFIFTYNGTTIYAPIQLYAQNQSIGTYAEEAIKYLKNLRKGEFYEMRPYNFTPEDRDRAIIGISFKDESGQKIERALSNAYYKDGKLVKGDVPAVEVIEKRGKRMADPTSLLEKTDYLFDHLTEQLERLEGKAPSTGGTAPGESPNDAPERPAQTVPPKEEKEESAPNKETESAEVEKEEDDDDTDLPF